jgi:hypothetical protein
MFPAVIYPMMRRSLLCLMLLLYVASRLAAQQPGRPVDPTPLARPEPLVTLETAKPAELLGRLRSLVTAKGFAVKERKDADFYFAAQRPDGPADYDRILVWLERDAREPQKAVHVHLLYGRFEEMWVASGRGIHRVKVDEPFEDERIGNLKEAILNLPSPQ